MEKLAVVCVNTRQQSNWAGDVPMHYSNIATVALEQCIEAPPARAAGGSQFIEYKQRAPYASLTVNYLQNYLRLYFSSELNIF